MIITIAENLDYDSKDVPLVFHVVEYSQILYRPSRTGPYARCAKNGIPSSVPSQEGLDRPWSFLLSLETTWPWVTVYYDIYITGAVDPDLNFIYASKYSPLRYPSLCTTVCSDHFIAYERCHPSLVGLSFQGYNGPLSWPDPG